MGKTPRDLVAGAGLVVPGQPCGDCDFNHLDENMSKANHGLISSGVDSFPRPVPTELLLANIGVALLSIPAVLWWSVHESIGRASYWQSQTDLFLILNGASSGSSSFWMNVTQLGDAFVLLLLLSFLLVLRPQMWAAFFGAVPLTVLLTNGVKALGSIPRPAAALDQETFSIVGPALTAHNSFPSGHTATVFAAATAVVVILLLSQRRNNGVLIVLSGLFFAGTVAFSRIAVGAHWPFDIIVGAVFGSLGGVSGVILTQRGQKWWSWIASPSYRWIFGVILIGWSTALLSQPEADRLPIVWLATASGISTAMYLFVGKRRHP